MKMRLYGLLAVIILFLLAAAMPQALAADLYPVNPNLANREHYVADPAGILSASTVSQINAILEQMRRQTTVEMGVAVVPDIGDMEIQPYAVELFERWGLGNADNDNGVLFIVDHQGLQYFIVTGYGSEGVLTDALCRKILDENYVGPARAGDYDIAVLSTVKAVAAVVETPANAEALRSGKARNLSGADASDSEERDFGGMLLSLVAFVAIIAFVFSMVLFFQTLRKKKGIDNYVKAENWRKILTAQWTLGILSAGTGLPFAVMGWLNYRKWRTKKRKCPTCGAMMNRLGEEEDNNYLHPNQDFEENLGTVDWDAWLCPKCGTVERFPFRANQLKYIECPQCHTVAMCLKSDRVVRRPTTRQEGLGVKTYECLYCHHSNDRQYRIPRESDGSGAVGALAAGAILGSMAGRRGGGGGFGDGFGGGFGGGHTGGGGAGGHL